MVTVADPEPEGEVVGVPLAMVVGDGSWAWNGGKLGIILSTNLIAGWWRR
jgi:hypothetical protein